MTTCHKAVFNKSIIMPSPSRYGERMEQIGIAYGEQQSPTLKNRQDSKSKLIDWDQFIDPSCNTKEGTPAQVNEGSELAFLSSLPDV